MDLFNNPMINNALKAMTPEQVEHYKSIGEHLYGSINFEDSKILNNLPPPMAESVAYVEEGIKSGLSPQDLTQDEVILLTNAYGEKWFEKYGFKEHEVPEVGLSLDTKQEMEDAIKRKIESINEKKVKKDKNKNNKKK